MIDVTERLHGPDGIEAAREILRLRSENEKLREALKPFADDELHEGLGDGPDDERTHWPSFLLGDLRRARAALEGVMEKEGTGNE